MQIYFDKTTFLSVCDEFLLKKMYKFHLPLELCFPWLTHSVIHKTRILQEMHYQNYIQYTKVKERAQWDKKIQIIRSKIVWNPVTVLK